jgi:hypothetical protein
MLSEWHPSFPGDPESKVWALVSVMEQLLAALTPEQEEIDKVPLGPPTPPEGEGTDGADAAPGQEQLPLAPTRESVLRQLERADLNAYYAYAYAESKLGSTTVRQAYQWLSDNGLPDERESPELAKELAGYELPTFLTWERQARRARSALGEQKHKPRSPPTACRSIVRRSEIDCRQADDG